MHGMTAPLRMRGTAQRNRRRGAAAVEFALIMVVFLNFAVGSVEMMNLFSAWSSLQWACDGAARQTMVSSAPTQASAQSAAATMAASIGYTTAVGANFTASAPAACSSTAPSGTQCITISGTYVYKFKLATLGLASVTLTAQSVAPLI